MGCEVACRRTVLCSAVLCSMEGAPVWVEGGRRLLRRGGEHGSATGAQSSVVVHERQYVLQTRGERVSVLDVIPFDHC